MCIRSASSPSTVLWAFHTIQPSSFNMEPRLRLIVRGHVDTHSRSSALRGRDCKMTRRSAQRLHLEHVTDQRLRVVDTSQPHRCRGTPASHSPLLAVLAGRVTVEYVHISSPRITRTSRSAEPSICGEYVSATSMDMTIRNVRAPHIRTHIESLNCFNQGVSPSSPPLS